ncbi:MAG: hypothetical protein IIY93_01095 [Clostridia bacterium]|nr:hypothetical protein [Clostridia bacterium]
MVKILKAIWKIIKTIVFRLWISVLFVEVCLGILCRPRFLRHAIAPELEKYWWFFFILIILWFLITAAYVWISNQIEAYQRDRYRQKYFKTVTWEDPRLGKFVFDYDTKEHTLEATSSDLPLFFGKKPDSLTADMDDDLTVEQAFPMIREALYAVYDHEQEILTTCCEYVKAVYDSEDIRDEAKELISIETIRDTFSVTGFFVSINAGSVGVEVHGAMNNDFQEHIAEHGVSATLRRYPDSNEWHMEQVQ